jgi:LysM repeat protein
MAKMYGMTIQTLREIHNLPSNKLIIGQKINIPSVATQNKEQKSKSTQLENFSKNDKECIVQKGDSLSRIAKQFGIKQS